MLLHAGQGSKIVAIQSQLSWCESRLLVKLAENLLQPICNNQILAIIFWLFIQAMVVTSRFLIVVPPCLTMLMGHDAHTIWTDRWNLRHWCKLIIPYPTLNYFSRGHNKTRLSTFYNPLKKVVFLSKQILKVIMVLSDLAFHITVSFSFTFLPSVQKVTH